MTEPTKPEPSEGARRAAERIDRTFRKHLDSIGVPAANSPDTVTILAAIIDRETRSAEMRKALEKAEKTILSLQSTVRNFYQTRFGHLPPPPYFGDDDDTLNEIRAALKGGAL